MTRTQYYSTNGQMSLVRKKKINNLGELINIPTKAEEKSMIKIRLGPKI